MSAPAMTRAVKGGVEPTNTAAKWIADNPGVASKFPTAYGYFAPVSKGSNDYNPQLYNQQIVSGERQSLDPMANLRMGNRALAQGIYDGLVKVGQKQVDNGTIDAATLKSALAVMSDKLKNDFPGFRDDTGLVTKTPPAVLQQDLFTAANSPELRNTEAAKGIQAYQQVRGAALAEAKNEGYKTLTGNAMKDIRYALAQVKSQIVSYYPAATRALETAFYADWK